MNEAGGEDARPVDESLLDSILDGVYEFDRTGQLTYANKACRRMFGVGEQASLDGLNVRQLMAPESLAESGRDVGELLAGRRETVFGERIFVRLDGSRFWGEILSGPIRRDGEVVGVRGVLRDISRRKKAEQAQRESEQRFRTMFELSPSAAALTTEDGGEIIEVNERFCQLFNMTREHLLGHSVTELGFYSREARRLFLDELANRGEVQGLPMEFRVGGGKTIYTRMHCRRITIGGRELLLTLFDDETDRLSIESRLHQAEKMTAVGTLAAGLAHDFNNLLMAIRGYASLLQLDLDDQKPAAKMVAEIDRQVERGARIIKLLLGFARRMPLQRQPLDLARLVSETMNLFVQGRPGLDGHLELPSDLWPVMGDLAQLEQVLMNLFLNAWQAMEERGRLTVRARNLMVGEQLARARQAVPGRYLCLEVTDNGPGIDPAIRERIFEPFFTTKDRDKGTGLGLASVYGIVRQHRGWVDVDSELGRGTTFRVYLPAGEENVRRATATTAIAASGSGTILLVDDDQVVLDTCQAMLHRLGYRVMAAAGGEQAWQLYCQHDGEIDLVVCDVEMPDFDGVELYRRLRKRSSALPVLFVSGCDTGQKLSALAESEAVDMLQKPYSLVELSRHVEKLLRQRG